MKVCVAKTGQFGKILLICFAGYLSMALWQEDEKLLKPSYQAFERGEALEYRIHYGMIDAGKARFEVKDTLISYNGRPHFFLKVFGRSLKNWDWFYKVRDHYYSFMDTASYLPSFAYRDVKEGSYETTEKLVFKRHQNQVLCNDTLHDVPERTHDILSAIYYARCIDFSEVPTETHVPINTFFAGDLFPLGVTYLGKETVKTKLGKFRCRKFRPQLVEGRIFKGQDDMTVYVSDDKNQVPIRIESKIFVGKIQADLSAYNQLKYPFSAKIE